MTAKAAVMLRARRGAPKPRSSVSSAWPLWIAWSTNEGWCILPWSWLRVRKLTFGVRRTARRGTRRLRWHWCAIRTCRPCRRDGTGTCPQHTWAALGRMRSSDLVNVNLPRMEAYYFLGVNQSEWGRVEDTRPISLILSCTA